mgnify:FL=1
MANATLTPTGDEQESEESLIKLDSDFSTVKVTIRKTNSHVPRCHLWLKAQKGCQFSMMVCMREIVNIGHLNPYLTVKCANGCTKDVFAK